MGPDKWDVELRDGAVCRIFQDCPTGRWFLEGVLQLMVLRVLMVLTVLKVPVLRVLAVLTGPVLMVLTSAHGAAGALLAVRRVLVPKVLDLRYPVRTWAPASAWHGSHSQPGTLRTFSTAPLALLARTLSTLAPHR